MTVELHAEIAGDPSLPPLVMAGSLGTTAAMWEAQVPSLSPRLRLIRIDHRGASHARNLGTARARGRYLQYLDADDVLAPGKLSAQRGLESVPGGQTPSRVW